MTAPKNTPVTLSRLAQLLDAYGSDAARWPESERESALTLLQRDANARALHEQAGSLDAWLDGAQARTATMHEVPAALRARVLEIPIQHARKTARRGRFFGLQLSLLALVPCVLGFVSGTLFSDVPTDNDEDAWNEIASVAMPTDVLDEDLP
jgi:hypothetical protein